MEVFYPRCDAPARGGRVRRGGAVKLQAVTSLERRARRSADGEVVSPLTFGQAVRSEFRDASSAPTRRRSWWRPMPRSCCSPGTSYRSACASSSSGSMARWRCRWCLAVWMYSDVPATNVIAPDRRRMLAALEEPDELRLLWSAKNVALWLLVSPVCLLVATSSSPRAATGGRDCRPWCGSPSFLRRARIAGWLGIVAPYHPIPLRTRAMNRRPWRHMIWRWLALALLPYGFVPALATALTFPLRSCGTCRPSTASRARSARSSSPRGWPSRVRWPSRAGGRPLRRLGLLERRRAALRGTSRTPFTAEWVAVSPDDVEHGRSEDRRQSRTGPGGSTGAPPGLAEGHGPPGPATPAGVVPVCARAEDG